MLSPGEYHKLVKRDFWGNLQQRKDVLLQAKGDKQFQRGLMEMCRLDVLFWINLFVYQINPNKDEVGPFITWPFQERALLMEKGLLWCIQHKEDALIEKSRELGATWWFLIACEWLRLFHKYQDHLIVSKSAMAVDGPGHQSLFGKVRFIHRHLPEWMHDRSAFVDQKNYMGYPATNSSWMGFASTGKAGVSERASVFGIDEVAQIDDDMEVVMRTASTSSCRVFISTHMGTGTAFWAMCQSKKINKIQWHWTQHPDKNKGLYRYDTLKHKIEFLKYNDQTDEIEVIQSPDYPFPADYDYDRTGRPSGGPHPGVRSPWYDNTFFRMLENESEMAKDHDINPQGSVAQFYQPMTIKALHELCHPPLWEGDIEYDDKTGKPVKLAERKGGLLKLWFFPNSGVPPASDYVVGADVAQGVGRTPSCLSAVNARTGEKVLQYTDAFIQPKEFATLSFAICSLFANERGEGAIIAWETKGPGGAFGKRLYDDLGYRNVYFQPTRDVGGRRGISDKPGWTPTTESKILLHTEYRSALHEREFLNRCKDALDETLNFRYQDNSIEHSQYKNKADPAAAMDNHGDIVIADALANKLMKGKLVTSLRLKVEKDDYNVGSIFGRRQMRDLQAQLRELEGLN